MWGRRRNKKKEGKNENGERGNNKINKTWNLNKKECRKRSIQGYFVKGKNEGNIRKRNFKMKESEFVKWRKENTINKEKSIWKKKKKDESKHVNWRKEKERKLDSRGKIKEREY